MSIPRFFAVRRLAVMMICICLAASVAPAVDPPSAGPRMGNLPAGKILFLGNSITLHGPAPEIGWTGNWGMAASTAEKDYVHLLTARIAEVAGTEPQTMVKNIADFERQHADYDIAVGLKAELDFQADIVILAIGENVPRLETDEAQTAYAAAYTRLLAELNRHGHPVIFVRGSFWADPVKDEIMRKAADAAGAVFVDISSLGGDESNAARSERAIEHAGVAGHPGDKGMQAIADALWNAIEQRGGKK